MSTYIETLCTIFEAPYESEDDIYRRLDSIMQDMDGVSTEGMTYPLSDMAKTETGEILCAESDLKQILDGIIMFFDKDEDEEKTKFIGEYWRLLNLVQRQSDDEEWLISLLSNLVWVPKYEMFEVLSSITDIDSARKTITPRLLI
ncbi:MAG: hypothetical protein JXR42_04665 [Gammaproteobacteria bacterium]|nr:hypothetical protein [Gammaproteobacteria bacterium]